MDTICRASYLCGNVEKLIFKMSIGSRWKVRLEADGVRLGLLLGLSDEELVVANLSHIF
jgi:hypothetical protein